jgi:hypothetical protein
LTDACMQPLSPPTLHLLKLLDTCTRWPQKESAVVVSSQHTHTHTHTHMKLRTNLHKQQLKGNMTMGVVMTLWNHSPSSQMNSSDELRQLIIDFISF